MQSVHSVVVQYCETMTWCAALHQINGQLITMIADVDNAVWPDVIRIVGSTLRVAQPHLKMDPRMFQLVPWRYRKRLTFT